MAALSAFSTFTTKDEMLTINAKAPKNDMILKDFDLLVEAVFIAVYFLVLIFQFVSSIIQLLCQNTKNSPIQATGAYSCFSPVRIVFIIEQGLF